MNPVAEDILMHYGMPRRSGRYPWGSGENPYQHSRDFLARVEELEKDGLTEKQIADEIGLTTTQLRVQKSMAKNERRADLVATVKSMKSDGLSNAEIGRKLGKNESTIRSLLNEQSENNMNKAMQTADYLQKIIDEKGMIDVGAGVEAELGISSVKLNEALAILETRGYHILGGGLPQVTNPGKQTNLKVIAPPDTPYKIKNGKKVSSAIYDFNNVHSIKEYDKILTDDGTKVRPAFEYPASMDSKRLKINYAEDGGIQKDGVIEIRRGVEDLSLGDSHYAQVRILVDGTHYIKGMAVYSDNMPDGVDVIFNTNKKKGTPALGDKNNTVLKPIKNDPENPFGSLIKERGGQSHYISKDGTEKLSLINKRAEEGDWGDWADHLPSQFLSKQNMNLIEKQLGLAKADKIAEFDEICSLNNPTVKKALLETFANDCDSAAVHLQAAALPRQKYQVILPLTTIKDTEVYAPNYKAGEKVALIRYPHGGTFEIPILTVNNKQPEGKKVIGNTAKDAVGINSKVAERLSGADFDGDTVMVIPINNKVKVTSTKPLEDLKNFDPKLEYGPGSTSVPYKRMGKQETQREMGRISNLITDMTLKGASTKELARAVRHSMVVIDAEKHNLDYKRSEKDNNIAALRKEYQGHLKDDGKYSEGASTLISRAKGQATVLKRQGNPVINEDGSLSYKVSDNLTYTNKKGKLVTRTQKSTQMAETNDARTLSSGTAVENTYADYANTMKALANKARKEMINTGNLKSVPQAKKIYKAEVDSLDAQLNMALKNRPKEREAQRIANTIADRKIASDDDLTKAEIKKIRQQAITTARNKVGAHRYDIQITDKEWEAIQSGAITENKLNTILKYVNIDDLRQRATPRTSNQLSSAKIAKISSMNASGYTTDEIADALGVSTSTVRKYL